MVNDMQGINARIRGQMEAAEKEFKEIARIISGIGEKTMIINDIIFQTRLMAVVATKCPPHAEQLSRQPQIEAEAVAALLAVVHGKSSSTS